MVVNVQQGSFSGMMFTVGRLVRIKYFAIGRDLTMRSIILDNDREVRDWVIVREIIFV